MAKNSIGTPSAAYRTCTSGVFAQGRGQQKNSPAMRGSILAYGSVAISPRARQHGHWHIPGCGRRRRSRLTSASVRTTTSTMTMRGSVSLRCCYRRNSCTAGRRASPRSRRHDRQRIKALGRRRGRWAWEWRFYSLVQSRPRCGSALSEAARGQTRVVSDRDQSVSSDRANDRKWSDPGPMRMKTRRTQTDHSKFQSSYRGLRRAG